MASILSSNLVKKKYKILVTHDNNYCLMPSYLYDTASGKLEAFSDETNFYLQNKGRSIVTQFAMLERQRKAGLQDNIRVLSLDLAQTVYPREENTFLLRTSKRENFSFPWKDSASERYNHVSSSQIDSVTKTFSVHDYLFSFWPMDSHNKNYSSAGDIVQQGELMFKSTYVEYVSSYNVLHARFGRFLTSPTTPDYSVSLQAGKGPFKNSYDDFCGDIKLIYKDYSILPEYNKSEKVRQTFLSGSSVFADDFNTLSLRGTSSYSSNDLFLEQFVHTDYVDSKEYIENNFADFEMSGIKISIDGVKKLLPYDGFYPQQRSLQLSTLFSQSFAPTSTLSGLDGTFRTATNYLFSRGLFNSIRAGIACDMPMYADGTRGLTSYTFDRVPFEALMQPNLYMSGGYQIIDKEQVEDDHSYILDSSVTLGQSDGVYEIAMNNFMAEITNFFLQNSKMSSIKSLPNEKWTFDFNKCSKFSMNIVLSKDSNFTNHDAVSYYGHPYNYYAAPYFGLKGLSGEDYWDVIDVEWYDYTIPPSASWDANRAVATITFDAGAWANSLTSVSSIPIPTMDDIKTYSTITYTNENLASLHPEIINAGSFMALSASIEMFKPSANKTWNIYSKWECPVHNFVGVTTYNSASVDGGTGMSPGDAHRGVWHQYSTNTVSGLNLSLEYAGTNDRTVGSLIDACGFEVETKRVGNLADRKDISEYVVVIPYIVDECQTEKYFKLPLDKFESEYELAERTDNDNSIKDLIRKSRKCVLPPRLDFVSFRDRANKKIYDEAGYSLSLPPFAMYIFEFSSVLTKQDLSNIWQGVSPSLTDTSEFQKIEIMHRIKDSEVLNPQNLSAFGGKLPNNVRYKVFKAKAKALSSYEQIVQKTIGEEVLPSKVLSYNWPYDYFSLVEMAKVDVELSFEEKIKPPGN